MSSGQSYKIEQTKTRPQETLEFEMIKQMEVFSFSLLIKLFEEEIWLSEVTSVSATSSVFNKIDENSSFSITIPGHWNSKSAHKTIDDLNKILELRFQKHIELHVEEVKKKGNQIKIEDKECKLSDFDTRKNEILKKLRSAKHQTLEDAFFRMQFTYDEIIDILNLKENHSKK